MHSGVTVLRVGLQHRVRFAYIYCHEVYYCLVAYKQYLYIYIFRVNARLLFYATSATRAWGTEILTKRKKKLTHAHNIRNEYYFAARAFIMIFLALHLAGTACASFVLRMCARVYTRMCIHNIQKSL